MSHYAVSIIKSRNGIQRDNTPYSTEYYIQGQWVRFYEGRTRKIGGYKVTVEGDARDPEKPADPIVRTMFAVPGDNKITLYMGRYNKVSKVEINRSGAIVSGEVDITPAAIPGLFDPDNADNIWQFDQFTNVNTAGVQTPRIVALVTPDGNDSYSTTDGPLFQQEVSSNAVLQPVFYSNGMTPTDVNVVASGGLCTIAPVLTVYGNGGILRFSEENDCTNWQVNTSDVIRFVIVSNTKILKALRTWSGNTQSLLLWSTNALVTATWGTRSVGDVTVNSFIYKTIQDDISILSPNSIAQYNQMFFWVGIDQFYFYNGIVNTLENKMNNDWFYENINTNYNARCWSISIPRYKEIWFFYPRNIDPDNPATECNAVVIFNVEEKIWYDSFISRAAGIPAGVYPYPLMSDSSGEPFSHGAIDRILFPIWTHEFGYNKDVLGNAYAIQAYYETHKQDMWTTNPEMSNWIKYFRIAPDFRQNDGGIMSVTANIQEFPQDRPTPNGPYFFTGGVSNTDITSRIDLASAQGAIVSFFFESNTLDGFFQEGKSLLYWKKGDWVK